MGEGLRNMSSCLHSRHFLTGLSTLYIFTSVGWCSCATVYGCHGRTLGVTSYLPHCLRRGLCWCVHRSAKLTDSPVFTFLSLEEHWSYRHVLPHWVWEFELRSSCFCCKCFIHYAPWFSFGWAFVMSSVFHFCYYRHSNCKSQYSHLLYVSL